MLFRSCSSCCLLQSHLYLKPLLQVPRSSLVVAEDNDYAVARVVLFKRVVDDFKAAARSKGYQVGAASGRRGEQRGMSGGGAQGGKCGVCFVSLEAKRKPRRSPILGLTPLHADPCTRQVREYSPPAEGAELSTAQAEQLKRDAEAKKAALEQWCKTAYGEVGAGGTRARCTPYCEPAGVCCGGCGADEGTYRGDVDFVKHRREGGS